MADGRVDPRSSDPSAAGAVHEELRRCWDRAADHYHDAWGELTRQFVPHLLRAAQVRSASRVLDLACGPGYVAEAAWAAGALAVGVDLSPAMVGQARQLHPEIQFRVGDAERLPSVEASFDAVVCNFGFHHFSHPERAVTEARRALRRGGMLALTLWAPPERNEGARIIHEALAEHGNPDLGALPAPPWDLAECRRALADGGFESETAIADIVELHWWLPTAASLFEAELKGVRTARILSHQSADALAAIRAATEREVGRHRAGDRFAVPCSAYVVSARAAGHSPRHEPAPDDA